jgi:hypothetical protein
VIPPPAAGPEVEDAVVGAADISEPVEPVVDVVIVEHKAVFVAYLEVAEAGLVFVAVVFAASVADVAEPQASVDIVLVFDVLVPVSVDAVEVDSPGCPRFLAVPNVDHYASSSSSAEVVG